ncbi:MAG: 3-deoxy-D-manno-octulosonic acid kinase [Pseudomonadota bacterium]
MQRIVKTRRGQMLFDSEQSPPPEANWFDPDWWMERSAVLEHFGGRGEALAIATPWGTGVLKQYFRGGWVRHITRNRYGFAGADQTRSFQEWRITRSLHEAGLPVPEPLAAWFEQSMLSYTAALITRQIPTAQPLTEPDTHNRMNASDWFQVGALIARFARFGLDHADLNASNILRDATGQLWLIDFDRARLTSTAVPVERMHRRLLRSLLKHTVKADLDAINRGLLPNNN